MGRRWTGTDFFLLCSCAPLLLLSLFSSAQAQTLQLKKGVALEGWMDGPPLRAVGDEQLRQLPLIRAAGFDFVRLTVYPRPFLDARPGAPEPMATLERVLKAARASNLKVLVTLYDYTPDKAAVLRGGQARDTYLVLLERFAGVLSRHDPAWVGLEPMDEANDPDLEDCSPSKYDWQGVQAQLLAAARRGAPRLTLVASGACFSTLYGLTQLKPYPDKNLMYSFQYVDPPLFTQQGNPTYNYWQAARGVPYPIDSAKLKTLLPNILKNYTDPAQKKQAQAELEGLARDGFGPAQIRAVMDQAGGWARANGVSVLLKAFAVNRSAAKADRARWLKDVRSSAEVQNFAWTAWTWTSPYGFDLSEGGKLPGDIKAALGL